MWLLSFILAFFFLSFFTYIFYTVFISFLLTKAERFILLSALGSALVTRVPIDRCQGPSSNPRTPLHHLASSRRVATANLTRKIAIAFNRRSDFKLSPFKLSPSGALRTILHICHVKSKILQVCFHPSEAPRHISYVRTDRCTLVCNSQERHTRIRYTRYFHSAEMNT